MLSNFAKVLETGPRWDFMFRGSILRDTPRVCVEPRLRSLEARLLAMLNTLASAGFLYDVSRSPSLFLYQRCALGDFLVNFLTAAPRSMQRYIHRTFTPARNLEREVTATTTVLLGQSARVSPRSETMMRETENNTEAGRKRHFARATRDTRKMSRAIIIR